MISRFRAIGLFSIALAIGVGIYSTPKISYIPRPTTLSYFSTTSSSEDDYWGKYHRYFVDHKGNEDWWDWVYENRWMEDDSDFGSIKKGFGDDRESLSGMCGDVYGKKKLLVAEDKVWKYCSLFPGKPVLVKDDERLVSTKDNDDFWNFKNSELLKITNDVVLSKYPHFHNFWKRNRYLVIKKNIKEACESAYGMKNSGVTEREILKFCSLEAR